MSDTLTVQDVIGLSTIVDAASQTAKVAYMGIGGELVYGHARHICGNTSGAFLGSSQDIRQGYLRVTLRGGFEAFPTVQYLLDAYKRGEFAQYDW